LRASLVLLLLVGSVLCLAASTSVRAESNDWIGWARTAWEYFQPGLYVNKNTGLHYAAAGWPHFTDWDLGTYVEAIIDAEKLGIISRDGDWGANYRLEKVLRFLETRTRTNDNLPCRQYNADTGNADSSDTANPSDSAKLLLSLDDLRRFRSEYAQRINSLVAGYNFQKLADSSYFSNNDIYPPYVAQGYSAFGYSTPKLRTVESLGNGVFLNVYDETLPQSRITSEPLMLAILEDRATGLYRTYADRTFSAQQKRFEATGKLTAFSEGAYGSPYYYVYEWVVNDKGETWVIYSGGKINAVPIVYTKIAFAFHAIYNNQYTSRLVNELSSLQATAPLGGFYEGKSEEGTSLKSLTDKTNGIILAAARYHETHAEFQLNVQPSSLAITRGETGTLSVQLTPVGQFGGQVTLSVTGLPTGASYALGQQQATPPATVNLQVTTSTESPVGNYTINITGTSGSLSELTSATLTVKSRTTITLQLATQSPNIGQKVAITGAVEPARVATITVLVSFNGSGWTELTKVNSNQNGSFHTEFTPPHVGTYTIKAQVAGADFYLPPESLPATMMTVPEFSHLTVALVISLALSFLFARRKSMVTSSKRSADG